MFFNKIKRYKKIVDKINKLENEVSALSQEELISKTREFQKTIKGFNDDNKKIEKYLEDILPYAFAMVREASKRTLGMRHFDVQLIGGKILHEGNIAEMKTGEGKTLVITLPCYLNALVGKGVHVVTVNDYLAKRDKEKMEVVHNYLGLTVGLIQNEMTVMERRENYNKDITYVTNSEIGFDYLKDNLARTNDHKSLIKGMHYSVIDEVDSILIDEARTPLIISGQGELFEELYYKADDFSKTVKVTKKLNNENSQLEKVVSKNASLDYGDADAILDKKDKNIILTDKGIKKAELYFNIDNLGDIENAPINHHISQALKARFVFVKDTDYMIRDNKIEIIDEFTGRVLKGRKYSEGLHQALETKERVKITPENKTLASVTYQNLFRLYYKKSGLTGTGKTEEEEFLEIHNMSVIEVPTNKPVIRIDNPDRVYKTKKEKYLAIAKDIKENYEKGRPVLVGTPSVYISEVIDEILTRMNIPHNVLNAKNHALEAEIISNAGQIKAITVATNMAGRGTDIQISEEAKKLGGLKVIGVERHEARRIDNQLRGRAGRQGDMGESVFYLSLEDDLMKLFGKGNNFNTLFAMSVPYGEPIESKMLSGVIQKAQKQIEGLHYGMRKNVIQYDEVISKQRNIIYSDRNALLDGDILENYKKLIKGFIDRIDSTYDKSFSSTYEEYMKDSIKECLEIDDLSLYKESQMYEKEQFENYFIDLLNKNIEGIEKDRVEYVVKNIVLETVDDYWTDYLDEIDEIKKGANLASFKQQDPIIEFIGKTHKTFDELVLNIQSKTIKEMCSYDFQCLKIINEEEEEQIAL